MQWEDIVGDGLTSPASSDASWTVPAPNVTGEKILNLDVAEINQWLEGEDNWGWLIKSSSSDGFDFFASEYSDLSKTPKLIVTVRTHDQCEDAEQLDDLEYGASMSVSGSTVGTTPDGEVGCNIATESTGVWYKVRSNVDTTLYASMCDGTDYDAMLAIFEGSSCGAQSCLANDDDGCSAGGPSILEVQVEAGKDYYILVTGYSTSIGQYQLNLSTGDEPTNPFETDYVGCFIDASDRAMEYQWAQASSMADCIPHCRGLGYQFAGLQYMTECFCGNEYDRYGEDQPNDSSNCDLPCTVSPDESHLICGGGWRNSVYRTGVPGNDQCQGAEQVADLEYGSSTSVSGSTDYASVESGVSCNIDSGTTLDPASKGVWYKVRSNVDTTLYASMCDGTDYDAMLAIFEGSSCGAQSCLAINDDGCSSGGPSILEVQVEAGKDYYILVTGYSTSIGQYQLNLSTGDTPVTTTVSC